MTGRCNGILGGTCASWSSVRVASLLLCGTVVVSAAQGAESGESDGKSTLEEIVVTAQKRAESLQKVPLAITAFSGDKLALMQVNSLADLSRIAPGVVSGNQYGTNRLFIRGIGLTSIAIGADPSSAFHVDGVYVGRPSAQLTSFFDIERVELLRGPQGTLYGRNATGGSVNVITRRPTDTLEGYVNLGYGNYNRTEMEGAVGGPLSEDGRLTGRIAVQTIDRNGYGRNLNKADPTSRETQDIDDENRQSLRVSLAFRPSEIVDMSLIGEYSRERDHNYATHSLGAYPGNVLAGTLEGYQALSNSRNIVSSASETNERTGYAVTGTVGIDVSDSIRIQSISGWRQWDRLNDPDAESTSAPTHGAEYGEGSKQVSEELQFNYTTDTLKGIVGLFYYKERIANHTYLDFSQQNFCTAAAPCFFPSSYEENGKSDDTVFAAFTQWTYSILPSVRVTGGLRYSDEERTNEGFFQGVLVPVVPLDEKASWDAVTPKFGVDVDLADDVLLYASYTKGFKSGIFNIGQANPPIDPEKVTAYEAGLKFTTSDRRLEASLAAFYYDYTDLQVNKVIGLQTVTVNAASAKNKGVEMSGRMQVTDGFTLNGDVTYLDATFSAFDSTSPLFPTAGEADLSGNQLPGANKWGGNLGAEYAFDLASGEVVARVDGSYKSRIFFSEFNLLPQSQEAVAKVDASLRYATGDARWSVTLWGKNLTDETVVSNNTLSIALWGYPMIGSYEPPRTYGVTIGGKF